METKPRLDLDAVREKLAGVQGQRYWRGLEEIAETPEFQNWLDDEFPNRSSIAQIDRRTLLKYMGASFALAGLTGCRGVFLEQEKIVPYVKQPEEVLLGKPLYYATSFIEGGYAQGVLVEQHEGRPTKIEGNPEHPASLGATTPQMQASILTMYDPDRAGNVTNFGDISTWDAFLATARTRLGEQAAKQGAGIRILTESVTSPTMARQISRMKAAYPGMTWHQWEPVAYDGNREGAVLAFGQPVNTVYNFANAKVIVSLDAEFLISMPGSLAYARQFADGRRIRGATGSMNRLYAVESMPTITGAMADHRWAVRASQVEAFARALAGALGVGGASDATVIPMNAFQALVADLQANRGACVVVPGQEQPASVHALAHAINAALGAVGSTVTYTDPAEAQPVVHLQSLRELVDAMNAGSVDVLLILGGNPVYDAPEDFKFADAMGKVPFKVHHSTYFTETSERCDWHLPETYYLEQWGDARAYDGTISIIQPLINPLFDSRSHIRLISDLMQQPAQDYDTVKDTYRSLGLGGANFEKSWRAWLHNGVIPNTKLPARTVTASTTIPATAALAGSVEIIFQADPNIRDGRYANNGWLQELPKPLTKVTWTNVAHMSPQFAKDSNLNNQDKIQIVSNGRTMECVAWITPGHPDKAVTVHLGYGRTRGGSVQQVGYNAYALRTSSGMYFAPAEIRPIGGQEGIASTQLYHTLHGHDIIREGSLEEFGRNPELPNPEALSAEKLRERNLYPEKIFEYNGPQWGMTIDMNTCIGCNSCVIACQAENNIPIVGKEQVDKGRELHWLRIDRYYTAEESGGHANLDNPKTIFQPMLCVQCEKAPCEPVCPVAATIHSHEGLNQMVYNRCVGTRYCSNNCPYKVRRFNYLNYSDNQIQFMKPSTPGATEPKTTQAIPLLRMLNNPDVTVRGRGIMEKCTFCVQRINEVRIEAKKLGRDPLDGEIVTACQQACPTRTIVFGNIADPNSEVNKWRYDPRAYEVLAELQTRPRTSHLARLRNPNPAIEA